MPFLVHTGLGITPNIEHQVVKVPTTLPLIPKHIACFERTDRTSATGVRGFFRQFDKAARQPSIGEYSAPQQIKLGPTVALTFDGLESIHKAFRLSIRPIQCARRAHWRIVFPQPVGKAAQRGYP
jgi:hypothetical protein